MVYVVILMTKVISRWCYIQKKIVCFYFLRST